MRRTLTILVSALVISQAGLAQDTVEDTIRKHYDLALRWDNIEECPEWVGGVEPQKEAGSRRRSIRLEPGQQTCVRIAPYEMLRLEFSESQDVSHQCVTVGLSNGSGLLSYTRAIPVDDGLNWVVAPRSPFPLLAWICRPCEFTEGTAFTAYASRHEPLTKPVEYRDVIPIHHCAARMMTSVETDPQRFWAVNRCQSYSVDVQEGRRYCLQGRYWYPACEGKFPQTWRVFVKDGKTGETLAIVEYASSHETAHIVTFGGNPVVVSRMENEYFEIEGDGHRRIVLESSAPMIARLLKLPRTSHDYLFANPNAPSPRPGDVAAGQRDEFFQDTPWHIRESRLAEVLAAPDQSDVQTLVHSALRLARDNHYREGGMLSQHLLMNAGFPRRDYQRIRQRWRYQYGYSTYYRDAMPVRQSPGRMDSHYFLTRPLIDIGKYRDWLVLAEQHREAGLKRIANACFTPFAPCGEPIHYHFPNRSTSTVVRVAVDRPYGEESPISFWVQFDCREPQRMKLLPRRDARYISRVPGQGEAALRITEGTTLDGSFHLTRNAEKLVDTGYFEFLVPKEISGVKVWGEGDLCRWKVGVQYRSSGAYELSEDEYRDMMAGVEWRNIYCLLVNEIGSNPDEAGSLHELELRNHWAPLRRFVQSRYRQFVDSVCVGGSMDGLDHSINQLDSLLESGEYYLAERMARWLYLYTTGGIRSEAWKRLQLIADRFPGEERLVLNRCVAMVVEPNQSHLHELCKLMRLADESDLALMLALALPYSKATLDERLACTYKKRWMWHYHHFRAERDHPAWFPVNSEKAETIKRRLGEGDISALNDWAALDENAAGKRIWRSLPPAMTGSFHVGRTVVASERDKYFQWYELTSDRCLEVEVPIPGKYRIECRPLHAATSITPLDGWVQLTVGDQISRVPVITNFRSNGLNIIGTPRKKPGGLVVEELAVPEWGRTLRIQPRGIDMIVRVLREEPEFPACANLPTLGVDTAAWLLQKQWQPPGGSYVNCDDDWYGKAVFIKPCDLYWLDLEEVHVDPTHKSRQKIRCSFPTLPSRPQHFDRPEQREIRKLMASHLWNREQHSGNPMPWVAWAEKLYQDNLRDPELSRVLGRIERQTSWVALLNPESFPGIRRVEWDGWSVENPTFNRRLALLPKPLPFEQYISGTDSSVAILTNRLPNRVKVTLRSEVVPFLPKRKMTASLQIGEASPIVVDLTEEKPIRRFEFKIPPGTVPIKIQVLDSPPNHFLNVAVQPEHDAESFQRKTRRDYFLATKEEPLRWIIPGPAWIRIDEYKPGAGITSQYRLIETDSESLSLIPGPQQEEALFRVHLLQIDPNKPWHAPPFDDRAVQLVPAPLPSDPLELPATELHLVDEFTLGTQEDGTFTFGLSSHSRRATDEDNTEGLEEFYQGDLTYRYYDEANRLYHRWSILGRVREQGENLYGVNYGFQHRPYDRGETYTLDSHFWFQDGEWAGLLKGTISQTREFHTKFAHRPYVTAFQRLLSLDNDRGRPNEIDQNIYTDYKRDHKCGISIGDELVYKPFIDTRIYTGLGAVSNCSQFTVDNLRWWTGWDQRFGALQSKVEYRGYRFLEDNDRMNSSTAHRLHLALSGEWWTRRQNRFEAGLSMEHFFDDGENSFMIFGRHHWSGGRMYRDFRPGEKIFKGIRERRIPHDRNNEIFASLPGSK